MLWLGRRCQSHSEKPITGRSICPIAKSLWWTAMFQIWMWVSTRLLPACPDQQHTGSIQHAQFVPNVVITSIQILIRPGSSHTYLSETHIDFSVWVCLQRAANLFRAENWDVFCFFFVSVCLREFWRQMQQKTLSTMTMTTMWTPRKGDTGAKEE